MGAERSYVRADGESPKTGKETYLGYDRSEITGSIITIGTENEQRAFWLLVCAGLEAVFQKELESFDPQLKEQKFNPEAVKQTRILRRAAERLARNLKDKGIGLEPDRAIMMGLNGLVSDEELGEAASDENPARADLRKAALYLQRERGRELTTIKSPTGEKVVDVMFYPKRGCYEIRWSNASISPNKFFSKAQELVSAVRERSEIKPLKSKMFKGLDYQLTGREKIEVDIEDFEPSEDLDRGDNLEFARFSTAYGDFIFQPTDDKENRGFKLTVITHINASDQLSQLVLDTSKEEIPQDMLKRVLGEVGSQASQRMSEIIVAKQKRL